MSLLLRCVILFLKSEREPYFAMSDTSFPVQRSLLFQQLGKAERTRRILGVDHPALAQAQAQLQEGDFLGSLYTMRQALRTLSE